MNRELRSFLALFLLSALVACGGGGGGGGGSGGTTTPPQGSALPPTLAVTISSIDANSIAIDPLQTFSFIFNGDIGSKVLTPALVQLTEGGNVVLATVTSTGATLLVVPTSPLKTRTDYKLTLKAGFSGTASVLASDYVLPFTTDVAVFEPMQIVPPDPKLNSGGRPMVAVGDINGDGRPDIVEWVGLQNSPAGAYPPVLEYTLNLYTQGPQGVFSKAQQIDFVAGQSIYAIGQRR